MIFVNGMASFASPFVQISIFNSSSKKYHSKWSKSTTTYICKNSPVIHDHSFFIKHTRIINFFWYHNKVTISEAKVCWFNAKCCSLFAILGSFVALWKWFTFYSRKVCFVKLLLIFFHIFVLRCIATNDAQRPKAKQKKEPTERKKMEVTRQHYLVVASKVATTAPATIPSSTKRKQWIMNLRSVAIAISLASKSLAPAQSVFSRR